MKPTREQCLEVLRQAAIAWNLIEDGDEFTEDTNLSALLREFDDDFDDISRDAEMKLGLDLEDGLDHEPATPGEWTNWIMTKFPEGGRPSNEGQPLAPGAVFAAAASQLN